MTFREKLHFYALDFFSWCRILAFGLPEFIAYSGDVRMLKFRSGTLPLMPPPLHIRFNFVS
jgi:hypothetical protein